MMIPLPLPQFSAQTGAPDTKSITVESKFNEGFMDWENAFVLMEFHYKREPRYNKFARKEEIFVISGFV